MSLRWDWHKRQARQQRAHDAARAGERFRARMRWLAIDRNCVTEMHSADRRGLMMAAQAGLGRIEQGGFQGVPRAAVQAAIKLYESGVDNNEIVRALARGPKEVESVLALVELGR